MNTKSMLKIANKVALPRFDFFNTEEAREYDKNLLEKAHQAGIKAQKDIENGKKLLEMYKKQRIRTYSI